MCAAEAFPVRGSGYSGHKPVEEMTHAKLWAVFLQYLTDEEKRGKIIEIINQEEGIAMAVKTLGTFTQSELDYMRESSLLKGELDWQCDMTEARREARREGRSEGRNEANLENAQKMKTMGFSAEQIQAVTGLSIEQITNNK